MADVFVSYARSDKSRVAPLVAAIETQGWSIWWDPEIAPGQEFDRQIAAELKIAAAVLVVWTPNSVESRWVRGEAREAAERGILVPVRFENASLPIDVRALHTTDLDDSAADARSPSIQEVLRALGALIDRQRTASSATSGSRPESSASGRVAICVLPFANMSGDAEQEYFADGISEDIITALSKLSQLFVIARNSSFTFKGKNVNIQEVGRNLSVRYVLEGSVRKSGNRVRITAQLIDATTGGHLWAERFDRDLTDIFAVQDDVTQHIVAALEVNLTEGDRQRLETERTDKPEAYDRFLRGREHMWHFTKATNRQALELLERAMALDPKFAPAFAFAGLAHGLDYVNDWSTSPSQSMDKAEKLATMAVTLDNRSPHAHWALAIVNTYMRRHDQAIQEAEHTISLAPNLAIGHDVLGNALHYSGRSEEALASFERAIALDPLYPDVWLHFQAQCLVQLGRYDEAVAVLLQRLNRNPKTDSSRVLLAASYGYLGRGDEARAQWQEVFHLNPDFSLEQRRRVLPYKNPADFERVVEGLRRAGLVT